MKRLVYLDAGVLIGAARGNTEIAQRAFEIINDPDVSFSSSVFVKLETLPKPTYNKKKSETEFYETFFSSVLVWAESTSELAELALKEGLEYGLGAIDSLHLVSAVATQSQELITTEGQEKPIHRTKNMVVRTIAT